VYLCFQYSHRGRVLLYCCYCVPVCLAFSKGQGNALFLLLCTCVFSILKEAGYHFISVAVYLCVQHSQRGRVPLYFCGCLPVFSAFSKRQGTTLFLLLHTCVFSILKEAGYHFISVTVYNVFCILKEAGYHFISVTVYMCVQHSQRGRVSLYFCGCPPVYSAFSKRQGTTLFLLLHTCVFSILKEAGHHFISVTVYLCIQHSQRGRVPLYFCDCLHMCSAFSKRQGTTLLL
jgi:hypothetical protein